MVRRNSQQSARHRERWLKQKPACAICGEEIDFALRWPDPRCFVVDHIIPIAKGGPHAFENTQPAHADCNSRKRARIVAPIVKRSQSLE